MKRPYSEFGSEVLHRDQVYPASPSYPTETSAACNSLTLSPDRHRPDISRHHKVDQMSNPRSERPRITLPPLSSLTSSVDQVDRSRQNTSPVNALSYRFSQASTTGHRNVDPDPAWTQSSDMGSFEATSDRIASTQHPNSPGTSRLSIGMSDVRKTQVSASVSPGSRNEVPPISWAAAKREMRDDASDPRTESSRPRSLSSPHRQHLRVTERYSRDPPQSELDRLLESLIFVQDINRRLGLPTGGRASPGMIHSPDALNLLLGKVYDELDILASFSQGRAEMVSGDLGLRYTPRPRHNLATLQQNTTRAANLAVSGEAGHPHDRIEMAEGHAPSKERMLFDEDRYQDASYYESDLSDHDMCESSASASISHRHSRDSGSYVDHAYHSSRIISRAASYEQLRAARASYYNSVPAHAEVAHQMREGGLHGQVRGVMGGLEVPPYPRFDDRHQQQMELLDRRRLAGKGMVSYQDGLYQPPHRSESLTRKSMSTIVVDKKRVRKRKNEHHQECLGCQAKETPEWRKGPMGPRTLCNACGLLYAKLTKRKQQEAEAAAKASGKTAEEIVREREESPGAKQASLEALRAELNLANGLRNRSSSSSMPGSAAGPSGAGMGTGMSHPPPPPSATGSDPRNPYVDPHRLQPNATIYQTFAGRQDDPLPHGARFQYPAPTHSSRQPPQGMDRYDAEFYQRPSSGVEPSNVAAAADRFNRGRAHTLGQIDHRDAYERGDLLVDARRLEGASTHHPAPDAYRRPPSPPRPSSLFGHPSAAVGSSSRSERGDRVPSSSLAPPLPTPHAPAGSNQGEQYRRHHPYY